MTNEYRTVPMKWAKDMGGSDPCACCGREMTSANRYMLHVIDGGANVLHPDDEHLYETDSGDMDWHAVGPECAKKFKGFAKKWEGV